MNPFNSVDFNSLNNQFVEYNTFIFRKLIPLIFAIFLCFPCESFLLIYFCK